MAIAGQFRQRHRWGLTALACYFVVLAVVRPLVLPGGVHFDGPQTFALGVVIPLTATFMYFLAIFSFGLSGDVAARQSLYPARMFTLPLTSSALAGWPMIFGSAAMMVLWLATRVLGVWPSDVAVPVLWPALLAASLLAWTQALTWMPYPLRGLRVIVTVLWLATIDAIVMVALNYKPSEAVMLLILAPHLPIAYFVARYAVARARRGDVPDWRVGFGRAEHSTTAPRTFSSAARAQVWFEWRHYGRSLPALVAMVLPFELSLLFVFRETPAIVMEIIVAVLLTPPFMAMFVAATRGSVTSFTTRRPMTAASLVAAKLQATLSSALAAWLLVLIATPVALMWSGTSAVLLDAMHRVVEAAGTPRAIAILWFAVVALVASTWKQLVQSLFIAMSGREWLVKASVLFALSLLGIVPPVAHWVLSDHHVRAAVWSAFPWILAFFVLLKTATAGWIAVRLHAKRILSDRALIEFAVAWDAIVLAVYGLLVWVFPNVIVRHYFLAFVAILAVPLVRIAAAPLALEANRHR
ncbi:MAG TPA: hypothetical protein VF980_12240 [Thermoanaerobaculia bacterium]